MISSLYNQLLYYPLFNALIIIYNLLPVPSLGLSVIILTVFIRLLLFPFFHKSSKNQILIQQLSPLIKELTEKYKNDREEQVKQLMALYKKYNLNPFSGFILLLVQFPILIALFHVFFYDLNTSISHLYSFVSAPAVINYNFLGLINLRESSIILVALAALLQYFQGRVSLPPTVKNSPPTSVERLGRQMVFIGPILSFLVLFSLPSVIGLYWLTTSLFSIGQQLIVNHSLKSYEGPETNSGTSS